MGDFKFPRSFGFTGSADKAEGRVAVRPHTRQAYAKGGRVSRRPPLKPSPEQVVGGTLAVGAGAAAYKYLSERGEREDRKRESVSDTVSGSIRRRRERELGLKKGGKVRKGMKNC